MYFFHFSFWRMLCWKTSQLRGLSHIIKYSVYLTYTDTLIVFLLFSCWVTTVWITKMKSCSKVDVVFPPLAVLGTECLYRGLKEKHAVNTFSTLSEHVKMTKNWKKKWVKDSPVIYWKPYSTLPGAEVGQMPAAALLHSRFQLLNLYKIRTPDLWLSPLYDLRPLH